MKMNPHQDPMLLVRVCKHIISIQNGIASNLPISGYLKCYTKTYSHTIQLQNLHMYICSFDKFEIIKLNAYS